jgi:transposase-like protein
MFWKKLSAEVDRGRSIIQVARRHRVRPKTLLWWRWQLHRGEQRAKPARSPKLLPVHVPSGEAVVGRSHFEVQVGRVHLRAEAGTDVEYVAALVAALRARC